jgi:MazG family protein
MIEELCDVLMQVCMHAAIGRETQEFSLTDITGEISKKLVRRHPHVFADVEADSIEEVEKNWAQLKESEGKAKNRFAEISGSLPALIYAVETRKQDISAGYANMYEGVHWSLAKVNEELAELAQAMNDNDETEIFSELGDVLVSLTNVAADLGVDPEAALRASVARRRERFIRVDLLVAAEGMTPAEITLDQFFAFWAQAKRDLR